jgi:hypothetical protein
MTMNQHTKDYISRQPLWHDRDLLISMALAFIVGFLIGMVVL